MVGVRANKAHRDERIALVFLIGCSAVFVAAIALASLTALILVVVFGSMTQGSRFSPVTSLITLGSIAVFPRAYQAMRVRTRNASAVGSLRATSRPSARVYR